MNEIPNGKRLPSRNDSLPRRFQSPVNLLDADHRIHEVEDAEVGDGMCEVVVWEIEVL